jgi:hypothetical protein
MGRDVTVEPTMPRRGEPSRWFADGVDAAYGRATLTEPRPTGRPRADAQVPRRLRSEIVDRLGLVARRHARAHAFRLPNEVPLARHVLVFFYREPGPADEYGLVSVATRLEKDGADVADPHRFVAELHEIAGEYVSRGTKFDPRIHLANRVEPMMSPAALYVGLGVTTLDPNDAADSDWPVQASADPFGIERPFRGIAALDDGTKLLVRGNGGQQSLRTLTSHTLEWRGSPRIWRLLPEGALDTHETEAGRIGSVITPFHELIMQHYYGAPVVVPDAPQPAEPVREPGLLG